MSGVEADSLARVVEGDQRQPAARSRGQEQEDIANRNQLQIVNIDCQKLDEASLQSWFGVMRDKGWYVAPGTPSLPPVSATTPASTAVAQAPAAGGAATDAATSSDPGPTGEGYIVQIVGFHYHNKATPVPGYLQGAGYVRETLVRQLQSGFVQLPRPVETVAQAALPPGAVAADPAVAGGAVAAPADPAAPAAAAPADPLPPPQRRAHPARGARLRQARPVRRLWFR